MYSLQFLYLGDEHGTGSPFSLKWHVIIILCFYVLPRISYVHTQCGFIAIVTLRLSHIFSSSLRCRKLVWNRETYYMLDVGIGASLGSFHHSGGVNDPRGCLGGISTTQVVSDISIWKLLGAVSTKGSTGMCSQHK